MSVAETEDLLAGPQSIWGKLTKYKQFAFRWPTQNIYFIFVKVSQYLKLLMFGCVGLCGDCFSTSPIPLLVKRFYCSFAIQSKERKERGGGGKVLFNREVRE